MPTELAKRNDTPSLDALTGGAFSAPTSGERAARVREWLASEPSVQQMQEVFKELSVKDKGAAKPLREKLDELKRSRDQETIGAEWALKAQALLDTSRLNVADAMAWQRDAAKAGAPLSREPLATVKVALANRVKVIEDLQHRVQVQREAAVLLAQRIEVLSTKPWRDAQAVLESLRADVTHWQAQAQALQADENWPSVDAKFPPLLEASRSQLLVVWEAFSNALALAQAAAADAALALPPVPVWADEIRLSRGVPAEAQAAPKKPKIDPELRAKATSIVRDALTKLEQEVAEGHGKASAGAAAALRSALKDNGRLIDDKLENQAHAALTAAGELEGWQRWSADQLREALVIHAEGLLKRPAGQAVGGRKMQDTLRGLREQWKQTDQGGVPNHALWKRFDEACNEAYKVVQTWLEKIKTDAAQNKAQRLALIEEVKAWGESNPTALDDDWKGFNRILHQFADRWRESGHMGEKAFAELQAQWKTAFDAAAAPLEAVQKQSLQERQAMIQEAEALGAAPVLRLDAVKALQQRWQAQAHAVPVERRQEQKLWDAFRKPIDEAFNRKTTEREKSAQAMSEHDRGVLQASQALQAANAAGDAQVIRAAMQALEAALQARPTEAQAPAKPPVAVLNVPVDQSEPAQVGAETLATESPESPPTAAETVFETPVEAPKPRKPVVAMRGDDRPGMKKSEPAPPARGARPGQRDGSPRDGARMGRDSAPGRNGGLGGGDRFADRGAARPAWQDTPRLGDAAFRAQREALEHAQYALKKLSAQAHGASLTQLITAWEQRDAAQMPATQDMGNRVTAATRTSWAQALSAAPTGDASVALLRLEMAAELPTPATALDARRALQLQLLTRRNDPAPAQTWGQDVAQVLASSFNDESSPRLQRVLKVLLGRSS
jgi:ATP-dependent RNA helicase SUPV3L1/SUV3